ncbi:hypothetical protein [uncultured Selenomonas sp.]|uniref:hypothetical protein n=1 Tax=uncultured Selenomonas sp. TaxID=159275 RepID=UPI0028D0C982|nr:hypothetical protein [uncultured Selenomonas sp.]
MLISVEYLLYKHGKRTILTESSSLPTAPKRKVKDLKKGTKLYNAKNTSGDSVTYNGKIYDTMIDLWEELTKDVAVSCTNENCQSNNDIFDFDDIVGAHVVTSKLHTNLKSGDEVLIIPLCKKCNHYHNEDAIVLKEDTKAVVLKWD